MNDNKTNDLTNTTGEGASAEDSARFTLDDVKKDTKRRQRKGSQGPTVPESAKSRGKIIRTAYLVVGASGILVGALSAVFLSFAGESFSGNAAHWLVPAVGTSLFVLLGIGLARSAAVELK